MRFTVGNYSHQHRRHPRPRPGAGSQVENFRRTTRRTVSADLTDCPWVSDDELCDCPLHLTTGTSFQREKDSLVLAFVTCSWD